MTESGSFLLGGCKCVSKRLKQAVSKPLLGACLTSLLLLTACARPLTHNEDAFAEAIFGDSLDRDAVTIRVGIGLHTLPTPTPPDPTAETRPARTIPEGFCTRTPQPRPPIPRWPAAFVLYNNMFFKPDYYAPDAMKGWPDTILLPSFLIMAHELVHVWQWQNRALTGYSPARPVTEAAELDDPYYWDGQGDQPFLSFGFEQQAALISDYLCFRLFEPRSPRVAELRAIISPVIPLDRFEAALAR